MVSEQTKTKEFKVEVWCFGIFKVGKLKFIPRPFPIPPLSTEALKRKNKARKIKGKKHLLYKKISSVVQLAFGALVEVICANKKIKPTGTAIGEF